MLCKNSQCMVSLSEYVWGDGYCSKRCMEKGDDYDAEAHDSMPHPDYIQAARCELAKDADLTDAMTQAYALDPRLPKIIYLKRKGKTLRTIGKACKIAESSVRKLLSKCAPNLLRACGLRKK